MASTKSSVDVDLAFVAENCTCENPDLHPELFYMELLPGTEKELDFKNPSDVMNINLK